MSTRGRTIASLALLLTACASTQPAMSTKPPQDQVADTERAFAATMAARDLEAFSAFIDPEAIFFSGPEPLHGKAAVLKWWARYFEGPAAPFSWEPDTVEVLASCTLAHSSGPVRTPDGKVVARFNSIWRLAPDGAWRIVFDKGEAAPPAQP